MSRQMETTTTGEQIQRARMWTAAALVVALMAGCADPDTGPTGDGDATPPEEPTSPEDELDDVGGEAAADAGDDELDWADHYGHLAVDPERFVERWNSAVAEYGLGYTLESFVWDQEQMGMEAAQQDAEGWLQIEAVRHPDGPLSLFSIYAEPTTEAQGADMVAVMVAAVHALTDLDPEAAFDFAQAELDLTEETIDPDDHRAEATVDGVTFEVSGAFGLWDLWAGPEV